MTTTDRYLNEMCALLIDSKLGYMDAARRANDPRLKKLLANISDARLGMVATVSNLIDRTGARIPFKGTFKGSLHRVWMAVRDIISNTADVNMIAECERGESYLVGKYDEAVHHGGFSADLLSTISRQREELMSNIMQIRTLDMAISDV